MTLATEPVARPTRPVGADARARCSPLGGLAAATLALHVRDPHVSHSWGVCPLYALTGVYCPGCGGLRGVNDLTDGHVGAAASSNLLLVLAVPFVVFAPGPLDLGLLAGPRRLRRAARCRARSGTAWAALVVAFSVPRNLPGSWLAP